MQDTRIAACFNRCFLQRCATRMVGGAREPLYVPADVGSIAHLYYREDFAASALHEAAHWCIAGRERRTRLDFGYTYEPPPRTAESQALFYDSEVRPQSLECLFARAAGMSFQPSADNLAADPAAFSARIDKLLGETHRWMMHTRDSRARTFCDALRKETGEFHGES